MFVDSADSADKRFLDLHVCLQLGTIEYSPASGGPHLCVNNGSHPEALGGPRHGQHGPQEDQDGQDQRDDRGGHHIVEHDDEVTHQLRMGRQEVVESEEEFEQPILGVVEISTLHQLIDAVRSGTERTGQRELGVSKFLTTVTSNVIQTCLIENIWGLPTFCAKPL